MCAEEEKPEEYFSIIPFAEYVIETAEKVIEPSVLKTYFFDIASIEFLEKPNKYTVEIHGDFSDIDDLLTFARGYLEEKTDIFIRDACEEEKKITKDILRRAVYFGASVQALIDTFPLLEKYPYKRYGERKAEKLSH